LKSKEGNKSPCKLKNQKINISTTNYVFVCWKIGGPSSKSKVFFASKVK